MRDAREAFMARALQLAWRGRGRVSPNPMVGAVIVRDHRVIAEGWHRRVGGDHAEVDALKRAGADARGADLFVNLEPCCHFGRTPPCTKALIDAGIRRVFISHLDPNPLVAGKGIEALRRAGIEVHTGLLENRARRLNAPFLSWISRGRPFVVLKMASTMDGRVADRGGHARWISSEASRREVHRMRSWFDGVLIGAGTAVRDDPLLMPTLVPPRSRLVRIVADAEGRTPMNGQLLNTISRGPVRIALRDDVPLEVVQRFRHRGAEVIQIPGTEDRLDLSVLLGELGRREMTSLLVEGGPTLAAGLLAARLVDEVRLFVAPKVLGDPEAPCWVGDLGLRSLEEAMGFEVDRIRRIGPDVSVTLRPPPSPST